MNAQVPQLAARHVPLDAQQWPHWKEYVATHARGRSIVGRGVIGVCIEEIEGTKDPNRGGAPRMDFVIYNANGNHWRLHPGTKPVNDAEPVERIGAVEPDAWRPAARTYVEPPEVFTEHDALLTPTVDCMGRKEMFRKLQTLAATRPWGGPLELTRASVHDFPWWLWRPTLATIRKEVIGDGVVRVALMGTWSNRNNYVCGAQFLLVRIDDTAVLVNGEQSGYWVQHLQPGTEEYDWYVNWRAP